MLHDDDDDDDDDDDCCDSVGNINADADADADADAEDFLTSFDATAALSSPIPIRSNRAVAGNPPTRSCLVVLAMPMHG